MVLGSNCVPFELLRYKSILSLLAQMIIYLEQHYRRPSLLHQANPKTIWQTFNGATLHQTPSLNPPMTIENSLQHCVT